MLSGALRNGDRVPTERELAEQFGVSRTAVREKGIIQSHPGRGTFITDNTAHSVRHSLGFMMKIGAADGSTNLTKAREILEPEIAALAAPRRCGEHRRDARGSRDVYIEADLAFHLALARAMQNALIAALLDPLIDNRRHRG